MNMQSDIKVELSSNTIAYAEFGNLVLSKLNPRQDVTDEEIGMLASSIETCGLINPLSVLETDDGKYEVVAGGRRLRAIEMLVRAKRWSASVAVVIAKDEDQARQWANAENAARSDLHPADEIRAYGKERKAGKSARDIALAFAVSETHVARRLKLADLPAKVLTALKAGKITLEGAKCFTICDDKKLIASALEAIAAKEIGNTNQLRRMLKPEAVSDTDRRAVFVGREAYEAKGGTITTDLFEDTVYFNDAELLAALFAEKLDAAAMLLPEQGWKWAEVIEGTYVPYGHDEGTQRLYRVEGELSEDEAEEYDQLAELAQSEAIDEAGEQRLAELQVIFFAPGHQVQSEANPPEKALAFHQPLHFSCAQHLQFHQARRVCGAKLSVTDPLGGMNIAHAARRSFYIGFKIVFGVVVMLVTLYLLIMFGRKKFIYRP